MRILCVTPAYFPFLEERGPAVKVRAIAEGLVRRGHSVKVLTPWYSGPYSARSVNLDGVELLYVRPIARYRATTWNSGVLGFCRKDLHAFDVVHIFGLHDLLGPIVARFAVRRRIPYVLEPLGMLRPIDRSFRLKRAWHRIFGASLVRDAAFVVATSQQEERELLGEGLPRHQVCLRYNGVDLADFAELPARGAFRRQWGITEEEGVVLFFGRLIPREGVDLLISAFAAACPDRGRLIIAGPEEDPHYVREMRELAKARGIESRIIFTGPLNDEQKKSAFVDCDVFALPSRYENFANSTAEAIVCGRPVIITEGCGISEFVTDQVGLVVPRKLPALTDALRQLLADRVLCDRFQAGSPGVAARLSWLNLLVEQEDLYELAHLASLGAWLGPTDVGLDPFT